MGIKKKGVYAYEYPVLTSSSTVSSKNVVVEARLILVSSGGPKQHGLDLERAEPFGVAH